MRGLLNVGHAQIKELVMIKIYDEFVDSNELQVIVKRFNLLTWNIWQYDRYPGYDKKASGMTAELDKFARYKLDRKILDLTGRSISRAYVNAFKPNEISFPHTDESAETIIIYCNKNYDIAYGGETVFFNDDGDADKIVTPRFCRAVRFPGQTVHCARAFNSLSPHDYRFTIAYKLL